MCHIRFYDFASDIFTLTSKATRLRLQSSKQRQNRFIENDSQDSSL